MGKQKIIITGEMIEINGYLARHNIVKKVVNTFIKTEYRKKGKGITFRYPVENLPNGHLFIARPGHKKNFDFKVEVPTILGLGNGGHMEIAMDIKEKGRENQQKFNELLDAVARIYNCLENDVNRILTIYPHLNESFKTGAKVEVILKVVKWLFIMEDIVYWDNEGRAFLFNFLRYVAKERDDNRLNEALNKVKNPDGLKRFMKKCGIEWL